MDCITLLVKKLSVKEECPICFEMKKLVKFASCSHKFCKNCIEKWLKESRMCPCCREVKMDKFFSNTQYINGTKITPLKYVTNERIHNCFLSNHKLTFTKPNYGVKIDCQTCSKSINLKWRG